MRSSRDTETWYTFYSESEKREYFYEPKSQRTTWVLPDGICKAAASKKKKSHFLGTNPGYTPPRITRTRDEEDDHDDDVDYQREQEESSLDERVQESVPSSLKIVLVAFLVLCVVATAYVGFESNGVSSLLSTFRHNLSSTKQRAEGDRDSVVDQPTMWKETPLVLRPVNTEPTGAVESTVLLKQQQVEESSTEQPLTDSKKDMTHATDEAMESVANGEKEVRADIVDKKEVPVPVPLVGEADIEEESVEETAETVVLSGMTNEQEQQDLIAVIDEESIPGTKEQEEPPAITDEAPSPIASIHELQEEPITSFVAKSLDDVVEADSLSYEGSVIETEEPFVEKEAIVGKIEAPADETAESDSIEMAEMGTEQLLDTENLEHTMSSLRDDTMEEVNKDSAHETPDVLLGDSPDIRALELMDQLRSAMKTGEDLMTKIVTDAKSAGFDIDTEKN